MGQTKRVPRCKYCNDEAVYAMQFIGEDTPTFYRLGWHIRGFTVYKVCEWHHTSFTDLFKDNDAVVARRYIELMS